MQRKASPNFFYLLAGLLLILVAGPIAYEFAGQPFPLVSQIAFSSTLIVGIWSLMESRAWFIAGIVLVVADLVLTAVQIYTQSLTVETITIILEMCFLSLSLVFALHYVLTGDKMDLNRIVGAVCVYLLLGVLFGEANMLVFRYVPDSFNGLDVSDGSLSGFSMIYYSFVTMTTLGYGDITPESGLARVLAYFAAIAGQFYIAILVAMAVGQFLSQKNSSDT